MKAYRHMTIVALAAVGLALAGCGGGGSSSTSPSAGNQQPTDTDRLAAVNKAVAAEAAARMAIDALTDESTDEDVAAAKMKVMAAEEAAKALPADHGLRATIAGLAMDFQGVETARTVASQLMGVNDALDMAKKAVDALHRAESTAAQVTDARGKVDDAQTELDGATALSAEQRTELRQMISAVDDTLEGIETYRDTDAGQKAVAEAAVAAADKLVAALTDESTPAAAGAAYAALQRAKLALAAADDLPENVKTRLNAKIKELEDLASGQSSITEKLAMAVKAVADLNDESSDEDVTDARTKVDVAKEAAMALEDDDARKTAIASLDMDLMDIEDERKRIAARPGLDEKAMALVAAIGKRGTDDDKNSLRADNPSMKTGTGEDAVNAIDSKGMATEASKLKTASTGDYHSIDDWMKSAYSKMTPAKVKTPTAAAMPRMDDTVVVYNNKGPDEKVGYAEYFGGMEPARTPDADDGNLDVAKGSGDVITDTVTIAGATSTISLTASGSGSSVKGTFHGLPGTFSCGAVCSINRLVGGKYSTAGTLNFTPDLDESDDADPATDQVANLEITIPDQDYMHFGYWKNASMKDGKPVYMVNAFSGGTMPSTIATIQDRLGTAKYAGPASGLYVRKEVDSGGDPTDLYHGQFTAKANLTASFGGDSVAVNDQYSITGMIDNFMDGDDAIDPTWKVMLEKAGFATSGTNAAPTNFGTADHADEGIFTGNTEGDKDMMGMWRGRFFGESAAVVDDTATTVDETKTGEMPTGIAGEFSGHFVNGHVLGAFGATKE